MIKYLGRLQYDHYEDELELNNPKETAKNLNELTFPILKVVAVALAVIFSPLTPKNVMTGNIYLYM